MLLHDVKATSKNYSGNLAFISISFLNQCFLEAKIQKQALSLHYGLIDISFGPATFPQENLYQSLPLNQNKQQSGFLWLPFAGSFRGKLSGGSCEANAKLLKSTPRKCETSGKPLRPVLSRHTTSGSVAKSYVPL